MKGLRRRSQRTTWGEAGYPSTIRAGGKSDGEKRAVAGIKGGKEKAITQIVSSGSGSKGLAGKGLWAGK